LSCPGAHPVDSEEEVQDGAGDGEKDTGGDPAQCGAGITLVKQRMTYRPCGDGDVNGQKENVEIGKQFRVPVSGRLMRRMAGGTIGPANNRIHENSAWHNLALQNQAT
jgi:hypothetical protein